jgi:DMSO/TMAO reductase YedYZ heme-binding membrane subunit
MICASVLAKKRIALLENSRFYVVAGSVCLSALIFFVLQVVIADERLRTIRLQQQYGLIAVLYWYIVLLMSAFAKVVGKKTWLPSLLFTRRAFGFMVAYFALLHSAIAFFAQLGGISGIRLLPSSFRLSIVFGVVALLVLLFMAALSIDKLVAISRFKHWKILSRISYFAAIITILHIWIIGTHVEISLLQFVAFQALVILFSLEAWRLMLSLRQKNDYSNLKAVVIACLVWLLLIGGLIIMKVYVVSYSKSHARHVVTPGVVIHAH